MRRSTKAGKMTKRTGETTKRTGEMPRRTGETMRRRKGETRETNRSIKQSRAQWQGITTNGASAPFFKIMFSYTRYIPKEG